MSNQENARTALVFGASGLVGGYLVNELLNDENYSSVRIYTRKPMGLEHPKVHEHVIDFNRLGEQGQLIKGDDLFICLGTTIRKAGSVRNVEKIDRNLPLEIARIANANGATRVAVVSSIGANPESGNYYLRIKGEMEEGIRKIPFQQIVIARPSMLLGPRKEFRFGEIAGRIGIQLIGFLLVGSLSKYRGIHGRDVARAMIRLICSDRHDIVYQSDQLQNFRTGVIRNRNS